MLANGTYRVFVGYHCGMCGSTIAANTSAEAADDQLHVRVTPEVDAWWNAHRRPHIAGIRVLSQQ